ncbi:unnamed protein product [Musa banksii]
MTEEVEQGDTWHRWSGGAAEEELQPAISAAGERQHGGDHAHAGERGARRHRRGPQRLHHRRRLGCMHR